MEDEILVVQFEKSTYSVTRWLFLRTLGVIYITAFASATIQVTGLIGEQGIVPAEEFLDLVRRNVGPERYLLFPTLAWLGASDSFLLLLTAGGAALALLLIANRFSGPVLFLLWLFYLSLVTIGQPFFGFQWDALLLETGFLAIFFAPLPSWRGSRALAEPSPILLWLFRWLLFRLMFLSGIVKIASGDPTWRNLTALNFHYETQPLPNPLAWYAHLLPSWVDAAAVLATFAIELVVPFFYFAPRRWRFVAGALTVLLQLLILLTGNYTFFNLLTIVLVIPLYDDRFWRRLLPGQMSEHLQVSHRERARGLRVRRAGEAVLAIFIVSIGVLQLAQVLVTPLPLPRPIATVMRWVAPYQIVNRYGLFAVMTTERPEIIIEGSMDGESWVAYDFHFKPDDPLEAPPIVAPHQPRLDWQLWFAALGSPQANPWFATLLIRLLEGSPEVRDLLAGDPFQDGPPRFVRALLYDYQFTTPATRAATGAWWSRELRGLYFPPVSLDMVR